MRGLEPKASFLLAGGGDMIHADPEYDMGITGAMKIAHFCQALGLDVQYTPAARPTAHCMAAIRNTHFYELALVGPDMPNAIPPVYTCGYSDQLEAVGTDGCLPVPDGPGSASPTTGTSSSATAPRSTCSSRPRPMGMVDAHHLWDLEANPAPPAQARAGHRRRPRLHTRSCPTPSSFQW